MHYHGESRNFQLPEKFTWRHGQSGIPGYTNDPGLRYDELTDDLVRKTFGYGFTKETFPGVGVWVANVHRPHMKFRLMECNEDCPKKYKPQIGDAQRIQGHFSYRINRGVGVCDGCGVRRKSIYTYGHMRYEFYGPTGNPPELHPVPGYYCDRKCAEVAERRWKVVG